MKNIIVPIDFSKEAMPGVNLALMLANKTGANIQMVHVIFSDEYTDVMQLKKEYNQTMIRFEEIYHNCKDRIGSNFTLKYEVKDGIIFKEISEFASGFEDAIIVLTTHGVSGFEELFIGGNAYKIISHSKIPVISVRRCSLPSSIDKIVLPLDLTMQTREKVPFTVKLAKYFDSVIHLVTVRQSNLDGIEKKLHNYANQVAIYLDAQNVKYKIEHLLGSNLTDETIEYSRYINSDLISIMTEQENSISNLLLGSYAHQMINKAFVPVLSFPTYQVSISQDTFKTEGRYSV